MYNFTKKELEDTLKTYKYIEGEANELESIVMTKIQFMIDNYCEPFCTNHKLIKLELLSKKEWYFCETCLYVKRMR